MSYHEPSRPQPADKGLILGKCNRTACWNRPATWFSRVENAHYCFKCAHEINKWIPGGVDKIYEVVCLVDEFGELYPEPTEYARIESKEVKS